MKHGTVYGGWREFCSLLCMQKSPITVNKRQQTNKILYNAGSWAQSEEGRRIISEKLLNRTDEEKRLANEKSQATNFERYGVTHYSKTQEYLERRTATVLEQTGGLYTNWFQDVNRIKESNLKAYGVDHYNKTVEGRRRLSANNGMRRPEIAWKSLVNRMLKRYKNHPFATALLTRDEGIIKAYIDSTMADNGFVHRQELAKHLSISYSYLNNVMRRFNMRDMYLNHGKGKSYKEKDRSEQWKQNVLRGQAILLFPINITNGHHTLSIKALDNHVEVDQWMIDFVKDRHFYVFPTQSDKI